jgi:hypothetical protein
MNLSTANSLCLAPLATAFQNERVTVEQYFDILIAHVTANGLTHNDDSAGPRSRAALISLVTSDAVCGAFRMWILDSKYPKLKADGIYALFLINRLGLSSLLSKRLTRLYRYRSAKESAPSCLGGRRLARATTAG